MRLTISEIQQKGSEMLRNVSEICERNNITWFMAYGSLLGAIRHHGPIPWDYDIDIYVPEEEICKFVCVMQKELPSEYWIDYRDKYNSYQRSFPRIGLAGYETEVLHVDVYRLSGLPENRFCFKLFALWSRILFVLWKSRVVDIDDYYPDRKRKWISKLVKAISSWIPLGWILKHLDKQASRIPLKEAKYASCPYETQNANKRVNKEVFDDSLLVDYANFMVRVPADYERYLRIEYGNWECLPPKSEQERAMEKMYVIREMKKGGK